MGRPKHKRKQQFQRAYPGAGAPGGATMYLSPQMVQSIFGQTFYGTKPNIPTQDATMFSPGVPLPTQPGVDKQGYPVQYQFPIAYNTFPIDRTQGNPDIPSFAQLRMLARLYSGITLCERAWFDMVPRMQLKIKLSAEAKAGGAEEKNYQQELKYFKNFFDKPDGIHDTHSWIRMLLREQTQIDEVYLYKHRTRGGRLLALQVVAGDTMKPLLDDWGRPPTPDSDDPYAYQQYPWGIPGMQYTTDMMIHYQESPAADSPHGQSRVERIIFEVNQALRKKRRDLAMFTEGNIPAAIGEVPDSTLWTPDQIDAFEQAWNSLIAGNPQQQVRVRFTMPGMKMQMLDNGEIMTDFDMFLLTLSTGCYGMSLQDIAFTGDIHKSSGDSQQNVIYRRTIDPLAVVYAAMLTECMHDDFEPSMHGDLFVAEFGGYDEEEDLQSDATSYSTVTGAGILGLEDAAEAMGFKVDPEAPRIGRVLTPQGGQPIFLDDKDFMAAMRQAQMAGFQLAATPGGNTPGEDEQNQGNPENNEAKHEQKPQSQSQGTQPVSQGATKEKSAARGSAQADQSQGAKKTDGAATRDARGAAARVLADGAGVAFQKASEAAQPVENTGMMLAFLLDPQTAEQLAIPGGEPASELHITLAYLGDTQDEVEDDLLRPHVSPNRIRDVVASVASQAAPMVGKVQGIGRFAPPDGEPTPVYAAPDVPGLAAFRTKLVQAVEAAGYYVAKEHDFTPHITLAYIPPNATMPITGVPALPLLLDTVCLVVGDNQYSFKLGGEQNDDEKGELDAPTQPQEIAQTAARSHHEHTVPHTAPGDRGALEAKADYRRWRSRALEDVRSGRLQRGFTTTAIPESVHARISDELRRCTTADQVRAVFERARTDELALADTGSWQQTDSSMLQQIRTLHEEGATHITWLASKSACDECLRNDNKTVPIGQPFPTGALLPKQHDHCECGYRVLYANGSSREIQVS